MARAAPKPSLAIIVPVLGRPQRVAPLMASVAKATKQPYRLLFVATEGDTDELTALAACRADFIVTPPGRKTWACKINDGFAATDEVWVFAAADDLAFHPDWFPRALKWAKGGAQVIGTNDICNPRVMCGQHSTHTLFHRDYVLAHGTIDEPGKVVHEGYRHDYADDEAIATATKRGVYVHAFDAIVEHLHPLAGKATDDATYRLGRAGSRDGKVLFSRRRKLWTDTPSRNTRAARMTRQQAARVRAAVPAPERAVVVTATYGGYDARLHVPVPQDFPVEFVCVSDDPDLIVPAPWRVLVQPARWPDDPRMSAKVPKMLPDVGCPDVVWIDASHEITSPSFVREALAARKNGMAAFTHPRRSCIYDEIDAVLGPENQNGKYFDRPLREQAEAYRADGYPAKAGLFACGTLAWDLRDDRVRCLGAAWLEETYRWSHHDQIELPVVARRFGVDIGTFPIPQIDPRLSVRKPYLASEWFRIHPHTKHPKASVLIPFSSTTSSRVKAMEHVCSRYRSLGLEVVVGTCEGEWSKGRALADAYAQATHDVLVIADADSFVDDGHLLTAIAAVERTGGWAMPHATIHRLNAATTAKVLEGVRPPATGGLERAPHPVIKGGGIVVVSRQAWGTVGGVDPRFTGWGGEDISFGWALTALVGRPAAGRGKLFHLWHEIEGERKGNPTSDELAGRYRRAVRDRVAMAALVAEHTQVGV